MYDIDEALIKLSLGTLEAKVLKTLMLSDWVSVGQIVKRARTNRPATYTAVQSLVQKGLVTRRKVNGRMQFRAVADSVAATLSARTNILHQEQAMALQEIMNVSAHITATHKTNGITGVDILEEEGAMLRAVEGAMQGDFISIWNPARMTVRSEHTTAQFLKKSSHSRCRIRELCPDSPKTRRYISMIKNSHHAVSLLPSGFEVPIDMILTAHESLFVAYGDTQDSYVVVIKDSRVSALLKALCSIVVASFSQKT